MNNTNTTTTTTTSGGNIGEKSGNAITNAFHGEPRVAPQADVHFLISPWLIPSQLLTA